MRIVSTLLTWSMAVSVFVIQIGNMSCQVNHRPMSLCLSVKVFIICQTTTSHWRISFIYVFTLCHCGNVQKNQPGWWKKTHTLFYLYTFDTTFISDSSVDVLSFHFVRWFAIIGDVWAGTLRLMFLVPQRMTFQPRPTFLSV